MPVIIRDEDRECHCPVDSNGGIVIEPVPISPTRTALRCMRCHGYIGYWEPPNIDSNNKVKVRPAVRTWSIEEARKMI